MSLWQIKTGQFREPDLETGPLLFSMKLEVLYSRDKNQMSLFCAKHDPLVTKTDNKYWNTKYYDQWNSSDEEPCNRIWSWEFLVSP